MAKVTKATLDGENQLIELDATLFHPQGGGQPSDRGTMTRAGTAFKVIDAKKRDGSIVHTVEKGTLSEGDEVELSIDEGRRERLTKMHTAEHLFYKSLEAQVPNLEIEKVSLDEHESVIYVLAKELSLAQLFKAEELANNLIREGREIKELTIKKEDVKNYPLLRIKDERIKGDDVRVIEIEGFDMSACSGTHLHNVKDIGTILVTRFNQSKSGRYEIRFKTDTRDSLFEFARLAREVRHSLQVGTEDVIVSLTNLKVERDALKEKMRSLSTHVVIEPKEEGVGDVKLYTAVYPGVNKKAFIEKVNATGGEKAVICFLNDDEKMMIAIRATEDSGNDASELLRKLFETFEGSGGGKPALAQGTIVSEDTQKVFDRLKEIIS